MHGLIQVPGVRITDITMVDLPLGDPWGWWLSRALLDSDKLAGRLLEGDRGLETILVQELTALRIRHANLCERLY
jgi:hypothetical protein